MSGLSPLADKVRPGFPMPPVKHGSLWQCRQSGRVVRLVHPGPFFVAFDGGSVDFLDGLPADSLMWRPDFHAQYRPASLLARAGARLRQALGRPA